MRINTNVAALNSYNQLKNTQNNLSKSLSRLSSGKRINSASDDAAGLAISEKMNSQTKGLAMAQRNAQDGISMIQTAEGALKETHSILQRMRELAVQSSNDTNTSDDRAEIQKEMDQLKEEINRIADTTEFNTKSLLNGAISADSDVAAVSGESLGSGIESLNVDPTSELDADSYTLTTVTDTKVLNGLTDASHSVGVDNVDVEADTALTEGQYIVDVSSTITANETTDTTNGGTGAVTGTNLADSETGLADGDYSFEFNATGTSVTLTYTAEDGSTETDTQSFDSSSASETITFSGLTNGEAEISFDGTAVADGEVYAMDRSTQYHAELQDSTGTAIGSQVNIVEGQEDVVIGDDTTGEVSVDFGSDLVVGEANFGVKSTGEASAVLKDSSDNTIDSQRIENDTQRVDLGSTGLSFSTGTLVDGEETTFDINTSTQDNSVKFQIGANEGQNMELGINDMRTTALGVNGIDVSTQTDADNAITTLDDAIASVSEERSKLGAVQNRLDHTINNLNTAEENLTAAESRISDVDMAKEMMNMSKQQILSQAGTAMMAQANQLPQGVLQLLG
jgi:flagellin